MFCHYICLRSTCQLRGGKHIYSGPILDQISVWLLDAAHLNINEKCALFLKNNRFSKVFWKIWI